MTTPTNPRKRVILKVSQKDGTVLDNAHEIEWLERQGWHVECAEPLLDDPDGGVAYVAYLLEWQADAPTDPFYKVIPKPVEYKDGGKVLEPGKFYKILCPTGGDGNQVTLVCHTTRGRILVHDLVTEQNPLAATIGGSVPGPAFGVVGIAMPATQLVRSIGVTCFADPGPAVDPGTKYPEAAPAVATVDMFRTALPPLGSSPEPGIHRLFQQELPPGAAVTYYLIFARS